MREVLVVLVMSLALLPSRVIAARPEVWIGYATLEKIGNEPPEDDRLRQPQRVRLKFRPGANGKMTCPQCFSVCKKSPFRSSQLTYDPSGRLAELSASGDCSSPLLAPSAPGRGLPFGMRLDCVGGRLIGSYDLFLDPADAPFIEH